MQVTLSDSLGEGQWVCGSVRDGESVVHKRYRGGGVLDGGGRSRSEELTPLKLGSPVTRCRPLKKSRVLPLPSS